MTTDSNNDLFDPKYDPLNRKFGRIAIWIGILAALGTFLVLLRHDSARAPLYALLGLCVGLLLWAITQGAGALIIAYQHGTRYQKAYILVAALLGIIIVVVGACQEGWVGVVAGLIAGAVICIIVLALAGVAEWVICGFRRGHGYRRLAILLTVLAGLLVFGFVTSAWNAVGLCFIIPIVWWLCGLQDEMELSRKASRVGWFVAVCVYLIASRVAGHGSELTSLKDGFPWNFALSVGAGIAAYLITKVVGTISGRKT